jgi:orotidine 5'-phosphate decarboxylase subfamily 2
MPVSSVDARILSKRKSPSDDGTGRGWFRRVIDRTHDLACCYKLNAAFWEQYGPRGWEGLARVREAVPPDVPVLLDGKRADVPNTMVAYAAAAFEAMNFDAATVHAYHGADSISVYAKYAERGVYVVCHTSNPGRMDLQHLPTGDRPLYLAVADIAQSCNQNGNIGVVIGATAPEEAGKVRAAFPKLPFLMPGIGRQGGDVDAAVRAAYNGDAPSCLISIAGAIMYADNPRMAAATWRDRIRSASQYGISSRP